MSTHTDKIIEFVKNETSSDIRQNLYTFEKCNALIISMELYLDRSNVSRILNELHRSGIFIKKSGRPTTYMSREVLSSAFPFASFPDTLPKHAKIEDYLSQPAHPAGQSVTKSFPMIGSSANGSLYGLMNQALPVFYLPKHFLKIIILKGNFGTGKKYFLRKLLERAKQMQRTDLKSELHFIEFQNLFENLHETLDSLQEKGNVYILNIDMMTYLPTPGQMQSFFHSLDLYYENHTAPPIIALTMPSGTQSESLESVTPMVLSFPDLLERPQNEIIQLILSLLQQESIRLSKNISVAAGFLDALCSSVKNCHQLKQEILYAVSKSLFSSYRQGNQHNLYLEPESLSDSCRMDSRANHFRTLRHFPDTITLNDSDPIDFSEDIAPFQNIFPDKDLSDVELSDYFARNFILCHASYSTDSTDSYSNDLIASSLKQLFLKSCFCVDPVLLDSLCLHITGVLKGDLNIKRFPLPDRRDNVPLAEKIETLALSKRLHFSNSQRKYITSLLHYCENLLKDVEIPTILVSRHNLTSKNYVNLLNLHYNRRWLHFFPMPKSTSKKQSGIRLNELYQFALKSDRGQGVLILTDPDTKSIVSNYLFPKTKLITSCAPLHSFLIFKEIADLLSEHPDNIFSVIPNLLIQQQNEDSVLKQHSLTSYTLRAADKHLLFAGKLMPGLHAIHTHEYFYKALKLMLRQLEITITNQRIFNFLFHGDCILFQRIQKMNFYDKTEYEFSQSDPDLMKLLKTSVEKIPELKKYQFSEIEYQVLYDALVYGGN